MPGVQAALGQPLGKVGRPLGGTSKQSAYPDFELCAKLATDEDGGDDSGDGDDAEAGGSQPANPHQRAAKARSQPGPRAHAPHPTPGSHRRPRDPPAAKRPNSQQKRRQDKGAKRKGGSWVWWRGTRSRFLMLNEDFLLKAMPRMFYARVGILYIHADSAKGRHSTYRGRPQTRDVAPPTVATVVALLARSPCSRRSQ